MPIWTPIRQRRAGRQGAVAPATAIPATPHVMTSGPRAGGHSARLYLSGSLTLFALDGAPAYHDVAA